MLRPSVVILNWLTARRDDALAHVRERWPELTFAVGMTLAVAADLALVWTGHVSISMATWIQTNLHPTLIAAGMLAGVGGDYLLWGSKPSLCLWNGVIFHLFTHW